MPAVADRAASLLDVDPSLAVTLGMRRAAHIGLSPVLPVIALPAGSWTPPAPELLGAGTRALVVLSGLLACVRGRLAGPGDVVTPWDAADDWTACTPVRLAVIGEPYRTALHEWPDATRHLLERVVASEPWRRYEPVDERVPALLWHLAARWGEPHPRGVRLPASVDAWAVAQICRLGGEETVAALARAEGLDREDPRGWVLREPPSPSRSTELRARMAEALAGSRAVQSQFVAGLGQLP